MTRVREVTVEGAADLDEAIAALRRELRDTLERAVVLEQSLALLTIKRLAQAADTEQERKP